MRSAVHLIKIISFRCSGAPVLLVKRDYFIRDEAKRRIANIEDGDVERKLEKKGKIVT